MILKYGTRNSVFGAGEEQDQPPRAGGGMRNPHCFLDG